MNISSILGVFTGIGVVAWVILDSVKNSAVFADAHAGIIVLGGTFAAMLIAFPFKTIFAMLRVFFKRVLGYNTKAADKVIYEMVGLAKGYRNDENFLKSNLSSIKHPFLKEAVELMSAGGISDQQLIQIINKRAATQFTRYQEEADIFKTLAKFPPAFGLLGAVVGMVSLMQGLGSADAFKTVGPAMAVAMVATFYGIALANFVFIPIGENLAASNREDMVLRQIIICGIELIQTKEHPMVVEEELRSYLLPGERQKLKRVA